MSSIFFDIDGTLLDRERGIPDSTKEAIFLLKKNGHHPFISTGRTKCMLIDRILDLDFDGYICGSGSYIEYDGEIISNQYMSKEESRRVVDIFIQCGMSTFAESYDYVYCDEKKGKESPEELMKKILNITNPAIIRSVYDENLQAAKVSGLVVDETGDPQKIVSLLKDDYECVFHSKNFLESYRKDISKGKAIRLLAERGIFSMDETYAYGDSFNDYDMLKTVKYGVAMGNSNPELLKLVPIHARGINEDGIYYSLKDLGLI